MTIQKINKGARSRQTVSQTDKTDRQTDQADSQTKQTGRQTDKTDRHARTRTLPYLSQPMGNLYTRGGSSCK